MLYLLLFLCSTVYLGEPIYAGSVYTEQYLLFVREDSLERREARSAREGRKKQTTGGAMPSSNHVSIRNSTYLTQYVNRLDYCFYKKSY